MDERHLLVLQKDTTQVGLTKRDQMVDPLLPPHGTDQSFYNTGLPRWRLQTMTKNSPPQGDGVAHLYRGVPHRR
jgi:hypothetical protein